MDDNKLIGKKTKAVPVEEPNIGIDLKDTFQEDIFDAIEVSQLDNSALENFSNVAQTREEIYSAIDTMSQDNKVSAILETYTDYVTETNDNGRIIWCESNDEEVGKYVNFLLDSLEVDKHAYSWAYNLAKYGDIYWRMFTESEYEKDLFAEEFKNSPKDDKQKSQQLNESLKEDFDNLSKEQLNDNDNDKEQLKENVYLQIEDKNDHLVHYIEAVANPGEMFELTKFGKTMAYIKAPTNIQNVYDTADVLNYYMTYKMQSRDVEIFSPIKFAHAYLTTSVSRNPEQVNIFTNNDDYEANKVNYSYTVRRGQSLLYNKFKTWRELTLLENSLLLNRVTKSAIVRVVSSEVKNMPKEQVVTHLQRLKTKIEQKSALDQEKGFTNYTNPGPMENIIYVPTRDGQGSLTFTTLGGDVDVKSLADIEYFENDFYGGFGIPKQYFGRTNDSTGFNGGTSLSIISSKFGKNVKSIQNALIQGLTTVINIFLLDKGLKSYINNFTLRMQEPVTQEYKDKQETMRERVGVISDTMSQINEVVTDELIKAKIAKEMLSTTNVTPEVLELLQDQIDIYENAKNGDEDKKDKNDEDEDLTDMDNGPTPPHHSSPSFDETDLPDIDLEPEENEGPETEMNNGANEPFNSTEQGGNETILPSPSDLGIDMTNSENI